MILAQCYMKITINLDTRDKKKPSVSTFSNTTKGGVDTTGELIVWCLEILVLGSRFYFFLCGINAPLIYFGIIEIQFKIHMGRRIWKTSRIPYWPATTFVRNYVSRPRPTERRKWKWRKKQTMSYLQWTKAFNKILQKIK